MRPTDASKLDRETEEEEALLAASAAEDADDTEDSAVQTDVDAEDRGTVPHPDDVLAHVAALRRYGLLLAGDSSDADDLVQECLLRVIAHTKSWRPVRDLRAYLFTTLHNVFVDGHRRRRTRSTEVPIETVLADLVAPPRQTKWMEVRDMVDALGQISAEQREVVLLVGFEGMSYMEAANVLGIPVGTVMSRLSRGREALRRLTTHGSTAKLRVVK